MTGIIGSGFALYGYMPTVVLEEGAAILLERAKSNYLKRDELSIFKDKIIWAPSLDFLLKNSSTLIICVPPDEQSTIIENVFQYHNIKNIIIEKPLSTNPRKSKIYLKKLLLSGLNFRISYILIYTDWFDTLRKLLDTLNLDSTISLKFEWHFKAYHYQNNLNNWKRFSNKGGGVIRFYGIHLIALCASLKFNFINKKIAFGKSLNEISALESELTNSDNGSRCHFVINSNSNFENFSIILKKNDEEILYKYENKNPFEENLNKMLDNRIIYLKNILADLNNQKLTESLVVTYKNGLNLWENIERNLKLNK